jgi:hypothetical protein
MIRISPHLISMRRRHGAQSRVAQSRVFCRFRAGDSPPAGNRPFTMSPEWGGKGRVQGRKSRRAPPRARRLSVRLSGL